MGADMRTEGHHAVVRGVRPPLGGAGPGPRHPGRGGAGAGRPGGRGRDRGDRCRPRRPRLRGLRRQLGRSAPGLRACRARASRYALVSRCLRAPHVRPGRRWSGRPGRRPRGLARYSPWSSGEATGAGSGRPRLRADGAAYSVGDHRCARRGEVDADRPAHRRSAGAAAGGDQVSVLAIDPSSPFSGGAILGDRVRMQGHAPTTAVFIRSMATRGHLGGLALAVPDAVRVLGAAGLPWCWSRRWVGQMEVEVAAAADTTVVVVTPAGATPCRPTRPACSRLPTCSWSTRPTGRGSAEPGRDLDRCWSCPSPGRGAPRSWRPWPPTASGIEDSGPPWPAIGPTWSATGSSSRAGSARLEQELRKVLTAVSGTGGGASPTDQFEEASGSVEAGDRRPLPGGRPPAGSVDPAVRYLARAGGRLRRPSARRPPPTTRAHGDQPRLSTPVAETMPANARAVPARRLLRGAAPRVLRLRQRRHRRHPGSPRGARLPAVAGGRRLWLLPFYPSPMRDGGYDVSDFFNVPPTTARGDLTRLLDDAHRRGIRFIADLVINHTSDAHPWFIESRRAATTPRATGTCGTTTTSVGPRPASSSPTWSGPTGPGRPRAAVLLAPLLLPSARPQLREPRSGRRHARDGEVLAGPRASTGSASTPSRPVPAGRHRRRAPPRDPRLHPADPQARWTPNYPGRVLLAEANGWPADVADYFGDGDECHLCFHFPLMPRLFMAVRREQRYPITEILAQTPRSPDGASGPSSCATTTSSPSSR